MAPWILAALTVLVFWLGSKASPGWMLLAFLTGIVLAFATAIAFAGRRIEGRSRPPIHVPNEEEIALLEAKRAREQAKGLIPPKRRGGR
ncbi:MAG: hypothetical protein KatS3mg125_0347 [Lysobacterales bacterium]|jgi:hypothetical protein|nr:MAG: hypothetical protein KatS3mg125_0347 [Xanthomonadales bacterium]